MLRIVVYVMTWLWSAVLRTNPRPRPPRGWGPTHTLTLHSVENQLTTSPSTGLRTNSHPRPGLHGIEDQLAPSSGPPRDWGPTRILTVFAVSGKYYLDSWFDWIDATHFETLWMIFIWCLNNRSCSNVRLAPGFEPWIILTANKISQWLSCSSPYIPIVLT